MTALGCVRMVLIFLAAAEACARIDDAVSQGAPLLGRYDQSVLLRSDEFGVAGRPNARFGRWRLNSLGFRGPELRTAPVTLLCIGASETFGIYEPEGFEYPRQLERDLNLSMPGRFQVVNTGLPGQSLGSFARRGADVVAKTHASVATIYPSPALYIDPPPEGVVPRLPRTSPFQLRIAGKLFGVLSEHTPPGLQTSLQRLVLRLNETRHAPFERIPEQNVERFRRDLAGLTAALRERGVRVFLVTHATRFGPQARGDDAAMLTAWRSLYPQLREEGFLDMEARMNSFVREQARKDALPLIDAARDLHGPENFAEFAHFTPRGAGVLAAEISNAILRSIN